MIKKQIHMYLKFANLKIEILRDFRVFILSDIPKNENSEITEIVQKSHNTEMWERWFKSSWNVVQVKPNSKSFSNFATLVAGIWVTFKSFWPSESKIK